MSFIYYNGDVIIYKIEIVRILTGTIPYVHVHAILYLCLINERGKEKNIK